MPAGSAFADHLFKQIGRKGFNDMFSIRPNHLLATQLPKVYKILESFGLESGAFSQLTREYMLNDFNSKTPDLDKVRSVI